MIRVNDLKRWIACSPFAPLQFCPGEGRRLKLTVNPAEECRLHLTDGDGETLFLSRVTHHTVIEVDLPSNATLHSSGECYVYSHDGVFNAPAGSGEVFTELAVRRVRNPEIEAMEARMRVNQLRFQEAMKEAYDAQLAALNTASAGGKVVAGTASPVSVSVPDTGTVEPPASE